MTLGFVSPLVVSYFAYGSNMHPAIFEGVRAIAPVSAQPAALRDHRLAFNLLGGAAEPSFAGLEPARGAVCHGVLYELTAADFARVCATEGVPLAYAPLRVTVEAGARAAPRARAAWTLRAAAGPMRARAERDEPTPSER